jgi:nucleoside-diphosphate-sugar epimerase
MSDLFKLPTYSSWASQVFVNVHDVALAHVSALTSSVAANKRYLLVAGALGYSDIVKIACKVNPDQPHRWSLPEAAKKQAQPKFDGSAAERDLGFKCKFDVLGQL